MIANINIYNRKSAQIIKICILKLRIHFIYSFSNSKYYISNSDSPIFVFHLSQMINGKNI